MAKFQKWIGPHVQDIYVFNPFDSQKHINMEDFNFSAWLLSTTHAYEIPYNSDCVEFLDMPSSRSRKLKINWSIIKI